MFFHDSVNYPLWQLSALLIAGYFVFALLRQKEALAQGYYFEEEGAAEQGTVVRFCTSWATTQAEVDALVADIAKL